jgi:uracil-DNA glycosylase family 4
MTWTTSKQAELQSFKESLSSCNACPMYTELCKINHAMSPIVGRGIGRIMFVGFQAPHSEHNIGKPFSDGLGEMLMTLLRRYVGVVVDQDTYITNVVKCNPYTDKTRPKSKWVKTCAGYLSKELYLVEPIIVVFFGRDTYNTVGNPDDFPGFGIPFKTRLYGIEYDVMVVNNPGVILRSPSQRNSFIKQLKKLGVWLDKHTGFYTERGIQPPQVEEVDEGKFVLVNNEAKIQEMLDYFKKSDSKYLALDTETTGLDLFADDFYVVGVSLAVDDKVGYYLPFNHRNKPGTLLRKKIEQLTQDRVTTLLNELLKSYVPVFHNCSYDIPVLTLMGVEVPYVTDSNPYAYHDTMILAYLEREDDTLSLKDLTFRNFSINPEKFKDISENNQFQYVDLDIATHYAGADAVNTMRLFLRARQVLQKPNKITDGKLLKRIYPGELKVARVMAEATMRGIMVDVGYLEALKARLTDEIYEITEKIRAISNATDFTSNAQLGEFLYGLMDEKHLQHFKDQFDLGVDEDHLNLICKYVSTVYPADPNVYRWEPEKLIRYVDLIKLHRKLSKLLSTYVISLLNKYRKDKDGNYVIRGSFKTVGTTSGRMSSQDPNLQNLPREAPKPPGACSNCGHSGDGWYSNRDITESRYTCSKCGHITSNYQADIRRAFVARPGMCFVGADYDQMEITAAAALSADEKLVEIVEGALKDPDNPNYDMHRVTAAGIYGKRPEDVTKEERQTAKPVNFGCLLEGTLVPIKGRGWVSIESVNEGDEVKTPSGYMTVRKVLDQGIKPVFRLTDSEGNEIVATDDHKFRVLDTDTKMIVWKEVKDLQPGDYLIRQLSGKYDLGKNAFANYAQGKAGLSRVMIKQWLDTGVDHKDTELLRYFLENDLYVTKVKSIEPAGEGHTWDLSVDAPHEFIANGFVVHNCLYLITEHGLQTNLRNMAGVDKSIEECRNIIESFFKTYPGLLDNWINPGRWELTTKGYITHPYGRLRHVGSNPTESDIRSALNFTIQGLCATITKEAVGEISEQLREHIPSAAIVTVIHDEIWVEAPIDKAPAVAEILHKAMNKRIEARASVQLKATPEVKFNLSKASKSYSIEEFEKEYLSS